ncbi:MAG: hypothetical protein J7L94_08005 [Caldisericaceae bacterium]|nr:hypothetical protein [Caldisericaceae bacterium]
MVKKNIPLTPFPFAKGRENSCAGLHELILKCGQFHFPAGKEGSKKQSLYQYQKYFEQNDFSLLIFPYAMELEGDFVFRASNFEFSNLRDGANSAAFKRIDCDAKVLVEWG